MQRLEVGATELGVLAHMMRKVAFFSPLTVGQLEEILPHVRIHSFQPGETVFKQGQKGDAFYIVYKGSVTVRLKKFLFLTKAVATLKEGDFFGGIALISDEPRTATVVAAEEMRRIGDRRKFDSAHSE